jgi:ADP-ribosylglycohydrolase
MVKGNLKEAMLSGTNLGRDIDCITAVASGISGSLTGVSSLPKEWIKQTDYATSVNIYTNSQRTIKETADGLFNAYQARLARMQSFVKEMASV